MIRGRRLGVLALGAGLILLAGCSHAVFPTSGGGGGSSTSPVILTMHDTPPTVPSGVTLVSFEVTITGAELEPNNVSLLSTPQTVELTQLQTNSEFLSSTKVATGTYTSLKLTYANPQYTFVNNSGGSVTVAGQNCAANAACVVTNPTTANLTATTTFTSSVVISQSTNTLIEADVNLNDIIQTDFSLDFSKSVAATVSQSSSTSVSLGTMGLAGQVSSVNSGSNQFQLAATTGQTYTIQAESGTNFEFARANCTNNNFTCIATGQVVDVAVNIMADGTFQATELDYDDAANTQQVSGMIVAQNGTPPTSVTLVVHNAIPPVSGLAIGTPLTVTISNTAGFFVNNGAFILPAGLSFASTSDVLIGQEVEARVAAGSSIANAAFTTDRLALEQTQMEAQLSQVFPQNQPFPYFILKSPPLISSAPVNASAQLQIDDTSSNQPNGTVYQNLTPANIGSLSNMIGQDVTVGGFMFNTPASPTIVAVVVRGEVSGT